jgi:DNA-binding winged helix-turn-helix (wHTH) protein/tetratricopeptide (TPR) repeat protein
MERAVDASDPSCPVVRFGAFELDTRSGELCKNGVRIRVADQSIQVLSSLLARPGEVVTREDLKTVLWPDGTNVDFENGLNSAVKKLRAALGDSGASPRYIETLPRRGYRLIVSVNLPRAPSTEDAARANRALGLVSRRKQFIWVGILATLFLASGALLGYRVRRHTAGPTDPVRAGWGQPSANAEANGYFSKSQLFAGAAGVYDLGRVRQMLERALQLDPAFGKARAEYGFTHLLMVIQGYSNDPSWLYRAEEEIHRGVRDDPNFSHGHAALAALFLLRGQWEHAPGEVEQALKLNPKDIDAKHWLAVYYWYSGEVAAARQLASDNLAQNAHFFPARIILGELARQEGDWEGSIQQFQQVLEYDPQNCFMLERLAAIYLDRGDMEQARGALERLPIKDRSGFWTRALEALLLARQGRRDEAIHSMDTEVLKFLDLNSLFTLTGAEFYALVGDRTQAFEWLERAVRNGDHRVEWFRRDPALENIRREERFQQILTSLVARQSSSGKPH